MKSFREASQMEIDSGEYSGRSGQDRQYEQSNTQYTCFGVFDGHGSQDILSKYRGEPDRSNETVDILKDFPWIKYATKNKEFIFDKVVKKLNWKPGMGGSTATIVWINKVTNKVRILWIGDSPAFVYNKKGKCIFNSTEKCDLTDSSFRDSLTTSLKNQCYLDTTAFQRVSPTQVRKLPVYRVGVCNTPSFGDEKKWHNQYNDEGKYSGGFMEKTFSIRKTGPLNIIVASDGLTEVYPKPEQFDFTKNCNEIIKQYLTDFKNPVYENDRKIGVYPDHARDDFIMIKCTLSFDESNKFVNYEKKKDSYVNFKFKKNSFHDRVYGRVYQPGFSSCFQRALI